VSATDHPVAVVVPIKGFHQAKDRLAPRLDTAARRELALAMAATLLAAADPLPVFVACDDTDVAEWAEAHHAVPLWIPARGLNEAVTGAVAALRDRGVTTAIIAHSDLPLASALDHLVDPEHHESEVVLVPDRHNDGTNVIVTPTHRPPAFAYGPGSFHRHLHHSIVVGHNARVVRDPELGWDIDHPADLDLPGGASILDIVFSKRATTS